MIADFLFSETPIDEAVMVLIASDSDGGSSGQLIVPPAVVDILVEHGYPSLTGLLPIESALAYGVILAGKANRSLVLTGDRIAWRTAWGRLIDAGKRLSVREPTARQSSRFAETRH
jgi:hypothetical protein